MANVGTKRRFAERLCGGILRVAEFGPLEIPNELFAILEVDERLDREVVDPKLGRVVVPLPLVLDAANKVPCAGVGKANGYRLSREQNDIPMTSLGALYLAHSSTKGSKPMHDSCLLEKKDHAYAHPK